MRIRTLTSPPYSTGASSEGRSQVGHNGVRRPRAWNLASSVQRNERKSAAAQTKGIPMSTVAPQPIATPRPQPSGRGVATAFGGILAVAGSLLALGGGGILAVAGGDGKLDTGR